MKSKTYEEHIRESQTSKNSPVVLAHPVYMITLLLPYVYKCISA